MLRELQELFTKLQLSRERSDESGQPLQFWPPPQHNMWCEDKPRLYATLRQQLPRLMAVTGWVSLLDWPGLKEFRNGDAQAEFPWKLAAVFVCEKLSTFASQLLQAKSECSRKPCKRVDVVVKCQ